MLHFTYGEAKKLTTNKYSSVVEISHDMSLSMSPMYIGNINFGLKETLNKELLNYNEQLKGVPLAYNNIKIVDSHVIDDQDLFKLDIKLSFVVFKPEPGQFLDAVVNKTTDHHIGCVIHNCINSSVRQPKVDALSDEQKDITNNIEVGDTITFKVWRLDVHHGILFVLGDIIGPCYTRTGKNKQKLVNKAGYSTYINPFTDGRHTKQSSILDPLSTVTGGDVSVKKEEEKVKQDSVVENVVEEKSPKKKKKKKIKDEKDHDEVIENNVNKMIKKEPFDDSSQNYFNSPCKTQTKEVNNIDSQSDSTPKKKKKKVHIQSPTSDSNNNSVPQESETIKEEPVSNDADSVRSAKKKKTNRLHSLQNNVISIELPSNNKHKHKDKSKPNDESVSNELVLTKKIYSSDKVNDDVLTSNRLNIKQECLSDIELRKSPKKDKNRNKDLNASQVDSPSKKKRKKDIKEETVSENESFHSDQELKVKKKKSKKIYTGS